ncbi:F-box protein At5g10340 [Eutrema salsugineum]|nr:F-box protein At5g10340 [Eutrema salsugineum]
MPTKRKRSLVTVNIPDDVVVEEILEKLPVKSVLRFRAVSKLWRREIESRRFQERHLKHQEKSREPSILVVKPRIYDSGKAGLTTLSLGATSVSLDNHIHYPAVLSPMQVGRFEFVRITRSCDGLVCLYSENYFMLSENTCMYVINPATRWYRQLPEARFQALAPDRDPMIRFSYPLLGFGKDDITGIHKLVWLYNSDCLSLDGQTNTCEVFSLDTNNNMTWRHDVIASCPHPILHGKAPAHAHGSLHWKYKSYPCIFTLKLLR